MAVFGLFNVVDDLAGQDVLKWNGVLNLENGTVLLAMQMRAHRATIEYNIRNNGNTTARLD